MKIFDMELRAENQIFSQEHSSMPFGYEIRDFKTFI